MKGLAGEREGGGRAARPFPSSPLLPLLFFFIFFWGSPPGPLPCQERVRGGPAGEAPRGFAAWFARALRALPPQRVVTSRCDCGVKETSGASLKEALRLLRLAWRSPGAASKALDYLARGLADLAKEKKALLRGGKGLRAGLVPPRFRVLLGRIQCAARIVQWELEERARREGRPRPPESPLTRYVSRILDLVYLSPEAGALVSSLLSERGVPPKKRKFYLRGVHLPLLEEEGRAREGIPGRPWVAGVFRVLGRRARANQALLEGRTGGPGKRKKKEREARKGEAERDLPADWRELEKRWIRAGRLPRREAFRERERMITALLADGEDIETALQGADLFYRTYPGFCSLDLRGWANLAWKKGAVEALLPWIRERWMEPVYRAAVSDALRGLWIGGGLIFRRDRILVEKFMVEAWREKTLPLPFRARVLPRIARAVTLPLDEIRDLLLEAYTLWGKTKNPALQEALLPSIRAFLERAGKDPSTPFDPAPLQRALQRIRKAGEHP